MIAPPTDVIEAEALDWVIRLQDARFDGWEAFETWLAADPAHAAAYQALAIADQDAAAMVAALPAPRAAPAPQAQPLTRRRWIGAAIAAALVGITSYTAFDRRTAPYVIETPAGVSRSITLVDGSQVAMNGGTRLRLDHENERDVRLEHGEALFTVVHNARQPFAVAVGDTTVVDVGTVFNISRDNGVTQVGVVEGSVIYDPDNAAVTLPAGRQLRATDGNARIILSNGKPADFGAWHDGRLVYAGVPIGTVAADLARNLGVAVTADASVANKPFRGVISLGSAGSRDAGAIMAGLGPLLDVRITRNGPGWRLSAPTP
jgi:transmembrane sensor